MFTEGVMERVDEVADVAIVDHLGVPCWPRCLRPPGPSEPRRGSHRCHQMLRERIRRTDCFIIAKTAI
jgi:hypothetical protein